MNLLKLPRIERFLAIKNIMEYARSKGLNGMAGECGELAVAMKRTLFDNEAIIVGGLNSAFESKNILIGHFIVRIADEEWGFANFDEMGIPLADDVVESWGMLDPTDPDFKELAESNGIAYTHDLAESACLLEFDDDNDVLINMRGSGLDNKISLLTEAMIHMGLSPRNSSKCKSTF